MLEEHIKIDPPASIWLSGKVMIVLAAAAAIIGAAWVQAYIVPLFVRPHP
ncbi:MAG: hypothetical protein LBR61_07085 [Synergistaceae bacterium]|jgi:hypothetical protein|nr:hypothetical protein [Synergistaceae bacterium]